jgi:hypothetical protein
LHLQKLPFPSLQCLEFPHGLTPLAVKVHRPSESVGILLAHEVATVLAAWLLEMDQGLEMGRFLGAVAGRVAAAAQGVVHRADQNGVIRDEDAQELLFAFPQVFERFEGFFI